MLNSVDQIVPISDMKNNAVAVMKLLAQGPVILAQRSRAAAVLLSVEAWNQYRQQLHDARLLALHYKRLAQMQAEPETVVDHEELEKEMAQKELTFARYNEHTGI